MKRTELQIAGYLIAISAGICIIGMLIGAAICTSQH